jgi:hypothetical protein
VDTGRPMTGSTRARSRSPGYAGVCPGLALPRVGDRIVLAVDVSPWLRPDAETSAQRLLCPVHGRAKGSSRMIPGWAYSVVAALGERARQLDRGGGCAAVGTGR